jgi:POT family proton-dependent oligopeptide transporter
MFENQPKGLYALALANTGERFGYYTMLAIFVLYLQAKFGLSAAAAGVFYSTFLMMAYLTPLFGGMAADKLGYGKLVKSGIFVMFIGYLLMALPFFKGVVGLVAMSLALLFIACGTGMFKGNLQVMVGNLYDKPQYQNRRDAGFSIFYMAINIGALFAPTASVKLTDLIMGKHGFSYDANIPQLCHQYMDNAASMSHESMTQLTQALSDQGFSGTVMDFCHKYIDALSLSYNAGFSVACFSLVASFLIYMIFRHTFKEADYNSKTATQHGEKLEEISPAETKQRIVALLLVFLVVIFFWMSFHQNGLSLTYFAREYTQMKGISGGMRFAFDVTNLVAAILMVYGIFAVFQSKTGKGRGFGAALVVLPLLYIIYNMGAMPASFDIMPQIFQQFNPSFVVALTPVSLAIFGFMAGKGKEPSAPRKIAYGMLVAAIAYCFMAWASFGLPTPDAVKAGASFNPVSPGVLITTYLLLTFGELLLSPMGISFVSKVAPPKYKGTMMGGWFVATAIGNELSLVTGILWGGISLWLVWTVLISLCIISFIFMMLIMKKLEKVC